jgi:hypothetical protein
MVNLGLPGSRGRLRALATLCAAMAALSVAGVVGATPALADGSGCPTGNLDSRPTAANVGVGASPTIDGNTATYTFDSLVNEAPTGGVPGLIGYCVYPATGPTSVAPVVQTSDGTTTATWDDKVGAVDFQFKRWDGNPSNVPLDGTLGTVIGTATWTDTPPSDQTILLHINDTDACNAAYPNGDPDGTSGLTGLTCWVKPSTTPPCTQSCGGPPAARPTASKTAVGTYDTKFAWTITKDVDKTLVKQIGGSATFNYTIKASHDVGTVGNVKVDGTISVSNPNSVPIAIDSITDTLSDGTTCSVPTGGAQSIGVGVTTFAYECTLDSVPTGLTNTATVSWAHQVLGDGSTLFAGSYTTDPPTDVSFSGTDIDECVSVTDTVAVTLGNACVGDPNPKTFTYSRTVSVPANGCQSYPNTATFTTNDTLATDSASKTVTVCGPVRTGALTIGFWKNTNGASLIQSYCAPAGKTSLAAYLSGLGAGSGPFSDAAGKSCTTLVTYVNTILKGATATNMNVMLKAQMLATALDVYFSSSSLGWTATPVGKTKPPSGFFTSSPGLGSFAMDLTAVCPMVDNTTAGTATCKNNTPATNGFASGAFPFASMTVQAILDYEATTTMLPAPYPFNGSTLNSSWYGGNRTLEEIAKNVFDQINNQLAFAA